MENSITKHNKDLISKILADTFGNKSFEVYGIHLPPIRQYLQTDFPDVQVTDRISDRFFLLADGSYALVDFEAEYRLSNKVKYLRYITRVLEHHLNRNNPIRLRFIVIYMGNVKSAPADYKTDCLTIHTEQAFLSHIDGDTEYQKILDKLDAGILLTDEDLMRIIILPLTYSRKEDQIRMVDHMIDTAIQIVEDEKRAFVLAGICIASDTFMSVTQAKRIGGILRMTRVGRMLQEEFDQLEAMIEEKKAQLVKQEEQLVKQEEQLVKQEEQLVKQEEQLVEKDAQLVEKNAQLVEKDAQLEEKEAQLEEKEAQLEEKEAQLEEKNSQVQRLQAEMRNTIRSLLLDGSTPEKVSRLTGMPIKTVHEIEKTIAEESGGN